MRRQGDDPPKLSLSLPSSNRQVRATLPSPISTIFRMTTVPSFRGASLVLAGTASFAQ